MAPDTGGVLDFDGATGPTGDQVIHGPRRGPVSEPVDQAVWDDVDGFPANGSPASTGAPVQSGHPGSGALTASASE